MIFLFSPSLFINGFYAKEIEYPRSCYNDKEIAALRAWEKEWAGKKIDSSNASAVREYLPESFYFLLTDTNTWGRHWFVIVPYREIVPTPGTIELTKKHHSSSKLDTESGELITYVAGVPFPNTTDPLEMAHNFRCRNFGDSYRSSEFGYIVDGQFRYDMRLEINNNLCFFSGRTDKQPVPEFPKNPKGLWRAFTMLQKQPPEVRNMRILELHYKDRLKAYDSWIWNPTIRRVRRRSTTERQDAQGGSDFCGFDNFGWDGPISLNTYRYIAAKELLMSRHNGCKKLDHTSGDCFWNGTQRERIRVHIIEATSKEANFLYSKMIWYIDPETWQILYSERYGRDGKLWKVLDQIGFVTAGYNNIEINSFCASHMVDVQRIHATLGFVEYEFGVDFPDGMFTTEYLQKHGY
ncbi:MAG: outer membrane lipoprotein-sorting protein [Desulfobacterota bacterium]|nr:outer membrane lipoprotein-sorting protein [Thermodesulfobacteriota bacterium]